MDKYEIKIERTGLLEPFYKEMGWPLDRMIY